MHVGENTPACGHQAPKHPQRHRDVLYPLHQPVKFSALPLCQIPTLRVSCRPCEVLYTPLEKQGSAYAAAFNCTYKNWHWGYICAVSPVTRHHGKAAYCKMAGTAHGYVQLPATQRGWMTNSSVPRMNTALVVCPEGNA